MFYSNMVYYPFLLLYVFYVIDDVMLLLLFIDINYCTFIADMLIEDLLELFFYDNIELERRFFILLD